MTARLKANADRITGELYIGNTKVAKFTDALFSIVDSSGSGRCFEVSTWPV